MVAVKSFEQLGVGPHILTALAKIGYERPSPVQEQSMPLLMKGRDLLAQAQTGTGKTAAFALPILNGLLPDQKDPQALIFSTNTRISDPGG